MIGGHLQVYKSYLESRGRFSLVGILIVLMVVELMVVMMVLMMVVMVLMMVVMMMLMVVVLMVLMMMVAVTLVVIGSVWDGGGIMDTICSSANIASPLSLS